MINQSPLISGDANIDNYCFMENREQQILSEIKAMVASIRSQLEMLDAKMVEFHQTVDPEGFKTESINVIIDDISLSAPPAVVSIEEIPLDMVTPDDDLPFSDIPVVMPVEEVVEETVAEPAEVVAEEVIEEAAEELVEDSAEEYDDEPAEVLADEPEDDLPLEEVTETVAPQVQVQEADDEDDDLPGFFDVPETVTVAAKAAVSARPTINDTHSADQAWRKDMPGTSVRDIRSAISLNDRVIFINNLFYQDAQAFVNALSVINTMTSLDEVVAYVTEQFPQWDLNSEIVYRFMMAVRRKVNG